MSDRIRAAVFTEHPNLVALMPAEIRPYARIFMMNAGDVRIIFTDIPPEGPHASISCADRDPTWDEIATVRYSLPVLKGVDTMAMFLPPLSEYVNTHPHCFHLYAVPTRRIIT